MEISDLPIEIFYHIMSYMPVDQLIKCRIVCSNWYKWIDNYRLYSLVVTDKPGVLANLKWYGTESTVNSNNQVSMAHFDKIIKFKFFESIFENLRYIYIAKRWSYFENFDIGTLNLFTRLERIGLEVDEQMNSKSTSVISLSNLDILEFYGPQFNNSLIIECPKLTKIKLEDNNDEINEIHFIYPSSVQSLECAFFRSFINKLINLEYLYIGSLDSIEENDFDLSKFTKLNCVYFNIEEGDNQKFFNQLRDQLHLNTKLKIYFNGVELDHISFDDLKDHSSFNESTICFYEKNHDKIASRLPSISTLNYSSLEYSEILSIEKIISKFFNLTELIINKQVKNVNYLIKIFKQNRIYKLKIDFSSLKQNFFDLLPIDLCPVLIRLSIQNESNSLNFEFATKFVDLTEIDFDQEISIELIETMLETQIFFFFKFRFQNLNLQIKQQLDHKRYALVEMTNRRSWIFNFKNELIQKIKEFGECIDE